MDPLSAFSLAASIVQFVQFGLVVAGRLEELSRSHEAPQALRSLSHQLPLLINSLSRIESSSSIASLDFNTKCILKGMVAGCMDQVTVIEKMIVAITPQEGESLKSKVKKTFTSLKYDEKILGVERNLQTYVQVLILHHVIDEKEVPEKVDGECYFDVREKRVENFVQRDKLVGEIEKALRDVVWGKAKDPVILVIAGEEKVGKTQLVLDYVHTSHDAGLFKTVFWIDASSLENLSLGFESIYATIRRSTEGTRQEKIRFVKDFFNDIWHPYILVLDNYESQTLYNDILDYLPTRGYGGILLLTRNHSESGLGTVLHVPKFITQAAQETLDSLLASEVQRKNTPGMIDLVNQGANPDALIWNEWPCLHRSALFGLEEAVSFLLESGANPNPPTLKIRKPIYWAASGGRLPVLETLLNHEDKIGTYNTPADIQSAFSIALDEGHLSIAKTLRDRRQGIKLSTKNQYDETPLQSVSRKGHLELVEFLLDEGVLDEDPTQGPAALLSASSSSHFEIVKLLVGGKKEDGKAGIDPNILDQQGMSPLAFAAKSRDPSYKENGLPIAEFLVAHGADVKLVGKDSSPLNEASLHEHVEMIKFLLEKGADPMLEVGGWDPLSMAIKYNCPSVIDILLAYPVAHGEEERRKEWSNAGLRYVCLKDNDDRVTALKLITAGADINDVEKEGNPKGATPLLIAILNGNIKIAQFLVRKGADQNLKDDQGRLPLQAATENGYELLVRDLVKAGGDKDLKTGENGDTLLMLAVKSGKVKVVKVLLELGASREEENLFGDLVQDMADEGGVKEIIELLEGWGN